MTNKLDDLEDAKERIQSHYNEYISVYDYGETIRVTNGSAGMYIDISVDGEYYKLHGERYGEKIESVAKRYTDELLDCLDHTL
jgi:hypothetical protein